MRCMVMEAKVVVEDRVIGVIRFQQMLEGSRSLLGCGLDVVDFYRREADGKPAVVACAEYRG